MGALPAVQAKHLLYLAKVNLRLITNTPLNSSDIVIKGGSLAGGNKYRLALFVTITDGLRGMNAYEFSTAIPPYRGELLDYSAKRHLTED